MTTRLFGSALLLCLLPALAGAQSATAPVEHHEWWVHASIFTSGVAAAADLSATSWAKGRGGFTEANPALRWASDDPVTLAVVKMSIDGAVIWGAMRLHPRHPKLVFAVMAAKTALSVYVAHRNTRLLGLQPMSGLFHRGAP